MKFYLFFVFGALFTATANGAGICDRSSIVQIEIGMNTPNHKPCHLITEEDLKSIEFLRIDFKGETLRVNDFAGLTSLRNLEISNVKGEITEETFQYLISLNTLKIDADNFSAFDEKRRTVLKIHDKTFLNLNMLRNFSIDSSAISFLSKGSLEGLDSLESFSFSNSFLWADDFDFFFAHLRNLKELSITDVSALAKGFFTTHLFSGLSRLKFLDLRNSDWLTIIRLDGPIFKDLTSLETLDLSSNSFYSFSKDVFSKENFSKNAKVKMVGVCLTPIAGDWDPYFFKGQLGSRLDYQSSCR